MDRSLRTYIAFAVACILAITAMPAPLATAEEPASSLTDPRDVIALFAEETVSREAFETLAALGAAGQDVTLRPHGLVRIEVPDGVDPDVFANGLTERPDVIAACPDFEVQVLGVPPNDTAYQATYDEGRGQRTYLGPTSAYQHAIGLEPVWDEVFGVGRHSLAPERDGVTIAVVDTGVTRTLREETGEYVMVWDYVNNDADPADDHGHGTHVASVIRGQTGNGYGLAGVLHRSRNRILVYKVLGSNGDGSISNTAEAMLDAAKRGAKIINLSLGVRRSRLSPSQLALIDAVVADCRSRGALPIAAAGNAGVRGVWYPAASPGALAVGSIDHKTGDRAAFSSYGPELDLVAPGEDIWGITRADTLRRTGGTSYSTSIVSGSIALLWSLMPGLTDRQIEDIVLSTADSSYGPGPGFDEETGSGKLDVLAAYERMKDVVPSLSPLQLTVTPAQGFAVGLSWPRAGGSGVYYRYGVAGGPTYTTTATSARLHVPGDGTQVLWLRAYASGRWPSAEPSTATVDIATGMPDLHSERLQGRTRYETAAEISREAFPDGAPVAVLASGTTWPDALAAGPLAYALDGPILITDPTRLSIPTRDELLRLSPSEVVIVGGTMAVPSSIATAVRSLLPQATVRRIPGADRYDTASRIAAEVASVTGVPSRRAFIASGSNWPDALAAAPAAAADGSPVLLTRPSTLPGFTTAALSLLNVTETVVVGGTAVVSDGVLRGLPGPKRVAGPDRYATARAIADWAAHTTVLTGDSLGVTTGSSPFDAIVASPLLASRDTPLFLGDRLPADSAQWVSRREPSGLVIFGGPVALTYGAENAIKARARMPR